MANLMAKRSIVHQVSQDQENLGKEKIKEAEEVQRDAATAQHKAKATASSWREVAAAAGVTLVEAGENLEQNDDILQKKKKTLKEMRTASVKRKQSTGKITESEKKLFKEAFNTDKTRLDKRHAKYNKKPNFLLLVEDNVHEAGPCGAGTAGMTMAYGRGPLMEQYLGKGVKYDQTHTFIHNNTFDFQRREVAQKVDTGDGGVAELEGRGQIAAKKSTLELAAQPTKYDLFLQASREAQAAEERRKRKHFDFDSE